MKTKPEIATLELIWDLNYQWMLLLLEVFKKSQNEKGKIVDPQNTILSLQNLREKSDNLKDNILKEISNIDENKLSITYLKSAMKFINSTEIDYYSKRMAKLSPLTFLKNLT